MQRWLACFCWALIAAISNPGVARAQFYQVRPQAAPIQPPSVNHIGVPGQALPQIQIQQFESLPVPSAAAPAAPAPGRPVIVRPRTVAPPYWFVPWRLRRR